MISATAFSQDNTKNKCIIQVVQHLQPGGIETMVLDFLRLSADDEDTLLISMEGSKEAAIEAWPRLKAFEEQLIFLEKEPGWHIESFIRLFRLFKKLKPDVVHTHHIGPMVYAATMARFAGVNNIIHTEHDAWHLENKKRRSLQAWVMRLARPVMVADAPEVATNLKKFIPASKPEIIHNGIDCERFVPGDKRHAREQYSISDGYIVGTAGRLETVKAQHVLIRAMQQLSDDYQLVIAGSGSQEHNLKQLVSDLNLQERVSFLGLVEDMPTFYQALDVFCLPSLNEGFPLSLLEAQASNVPVVASDVGGVSGAVCNKTGQLVEAENIEQLTNAIIKIKKHSKAIQSNPEQKITPRQFALEVADIKNMHKKYRALSQ